MTSRSRQFVQTKEIISNMSKQIKWIICGLIGLLSIYGCKSELDVSPGNGEKQNGIPVKFTVEMPDDEKAAPTKALTDKKEFVEGDVIHVYAKFTLVDGTSATNTETKYAALTLKNSEWVNMDKTDLDMDWPWNAVSAEFTAYFLKEWNGPFTDIGTFHTPVTLDRYQYELEDSGTKNTVTHDPDPLKATTETVEYGNAVHLKFKHLCARLTIVGVDNEKNYELRFKDNTLKNACTIKRGNKEKDDKTTLLFEFTTTAEDNTGVKISTPVYEIPVDNEDGTVETKKAITFHLAPGNYSTFKLTRPNGYGYISLSNVDILKNLRAGDNKLISLEELQGNITPDDADDDWWQWRDPDPITLEDFKVQEFMNAIQDCNKDYTCQLGDEIVTLLKYEPSEKTMSLTKDVDFQFAPFISVDLHDMSTFDGGKHIIQGVAHPLFQEIRGTIRNLEIREPKLSHGGSGVEHSERHDADYGILGHIAGTGANIHNVVLVNATLTIELHNKDAMEDDKNDTYYVGALLGEAKNGSQLTNISLMGQTTVTVSAESEGVAYITCVGGVVGQCSGTLSNVDSGRIPGTGNNSGTDGIIRVINTCRGHSNRYTGGIAGLLSNGSMDGCEIYAEVDVSEAIGTWNYAGGVAGCIRTQDDLAGKATIHGASIAGSVKGGKATEYEGVDSHSSTGGIVGHVKNASITDGMIFSDVSIATDYGIGSTTQKTYYTVGGVIGSMQNVDMSDIRQNEGVRVFDVTPFQNSPNYLVGTFCGAGGNASQLVANGNKVTGMTSETVPDHFIGQETP